MPIIRAKNHTDCKIDCPGDGYAEYHEPAGPCDTGCGEVETAGFVESGLLTQTEALSMSREPISSSGTLWASLSVHELTAARLLEIKQSEHAPVVKNAIENYLDAFKEFNQISGGSLDMEREQISYEKITKAELLDLLAEMIQKNTPVLLKQ